MAFEVYILPENKGPKMPGHILHALITEYANNPALSAKGCFDIIEARLKVALSANEKADIQDYISAVDLKPTDLDKAKVAGDIEAVLLLCENKIMYSTREALRARLGWR